MKSPVYMVLRDKNYYLVCEDEDSEVFQYFRIDMMLNVFVIEDEGIMDLSELEIVGVRIAKIQVILVSLHLEMCQSIIM